ncbi:hypothetical protein K7432_002001 [Basidiobolus ranarum]|uniref:Cyclin N-terminal domain-containing protein n=1 Tax=Basidiobolus ranarum TaxID=34480 RepID=A0ABR2X296_9FUNG
MVYAKQHSPQMAYSHQRVALKRSSNRLPRGVRSHSSQIQSRPTQHPPQNSLSSPRDKVVAAYASVYLPSPTSRQTDLFKKLSGIPGGLQLNSRVISMTANRIQAHWEGLQLGEDRPTTESTRQSGRIVQLFTYISTILTRTSIAPVTNSTLSTVFPSHSCVALVLALMYVDRLKKMHPAAKGEAGCGHRLFLVSYMVATKYIQAHFNSWTKPSPLAPAVPTSADLQCRGADMATGLNSSSPVVSVPLSSLISPNEHWARLSAIFSTPELTRMELELLSFLQFDLFVSYEDFKYHWTMYMEINQAVPAENPSPVYGPSFGDEEYVSEEFSVPEL